MSPQAENLAQVAQSYCRLIECIDTVDSQWLGQVSEHLTRLHSLVAGLGIDAADEGHCMAVDLDARFELYSSLRELLGEMDGYWMEFDSMGDGSSRSGSLADDLTDIYCELKHGLRMMEGSPLSALEDLKNGYRVHWGQHLVDAERHLYSLRIRGAVSI